MSLPRITLSLMLGQLLAGTLYAQIPGPHLGLDAQQHSPGTVWRVVKGPNFDVVFPIGMEGDAQRVAVTLERIRGPLGRTIGVAPQRITLVLQHQSTQANGYVALGPRRSIWNTVPPSYTGLLGSLDWLSLLAVHEVRHVAQQDRTRAGFTRVLHVVLGEVGQALGTFQIPAWLWEGDAVAIETALTHGGRGRMPEFDKEIRALALDGKLPGYYQALLGSRTNFFPDHYPLGYLLTARLRRTSSPDIAGRLFRRSAAFAWHPFAFDRAMRAETGLSPSRLYDDTMRELSVLWRDQIEGLPLSDGAQRTPTPTVYTSYEDPHLLADGSLVALRYGLGDLREVARIDGTSVTVLAEAPTESIRAGGTLVTWSQTMPDARWGWRDRSEIRALDVSTGRVHRVGTSGRWASPTPSPDGLRIAAIESGELGGSRVVVLDATNGQRLQVIDVPEREHGMHPSWQADGGALVLTRQGVRGKALSIVDLSTGQFTDLIPHGLPDFGRPVFAGDHVLFVAAHSGMDNIWAVNTRTGARYQVTSRRVGAYQPSVSLDASRLVFADYTSSGFMIIEVPLDPTTWTPEEEVRPREVRYFEPLVEQEGFTLDATELAADTSAGYPVQRIGAMRRLHVHSWSPVLANGELGASMWSTDVMNTLSAELTARYNRDQRAGSISVLASYAGLFPILESKAELGARSTYASAVGDTGSVLYGWSERSIEAGVRVPLDLSRGYWRRNIAAGAHVGLSEVWGLARPAARPPGNGTFAPITYGLQVVNVRKRAARDVAPRWGQSVLIRYRYTPLPGDFHARLLGVYGVTYVPAPVRNHGLRISGAIEDSRRDGAFGFGSSLTKARGYDFIAGRRALKSSVDYVLPLAYPDVALGPVLYLPRISTGAFVDYFRATGPFAPAAARAGSVMSSAGVELLADFVPLTWPIFASSVGMRVVHRFVDNRWVVEPVVRTGF